MQKDMHIAKKYAVRTVPIVILALSALVTLVWAGALLYGLGLVILAVLGRTGLT